MSSSLPAQDVAVKPRVLVMFNFDMSLVNDDSDELFCRVFCPELLTRLETPPFTPPSQGWAALMDGLSADFHDCKPDVSSEAILDSLGKIQVFPETVEAMKYAVKQHNATTVVMSDGNTAFIQSFLDHHGLSKHVPQVQANPGVWEEITPGKYRLRVKPYHADDQEPHGCDQCPKNLCKDLNGKKFGLMHRIESSPDSIRAQVVPWKSGIDILNSFKRILEPMLVNPSPTSSVLVIWWGAICGVHLFALAYHARITSFYWRLPGSPLGEMLGLFELVLPYINCRCVAVVNVAIATVHGVAVLRMIRNSARARQLIFYVDDIPDEDPGSSEKQSKIRQLYSDLVGLFAYNGPLGVEGKYFDFLLYTAEFVGALLQTYQAYRVNSVVARRWLSRLYVGVLVSDCWSVPVIHTVYSGRIAHKRLLSLMCDCVLDLVSAVVVPATLFFVYLDDYVPATRSFERTRWYDDRWLVQLWSEHDLVMIISWIDALSRLVFAVGLLFSMESVKQLLRVEAVRVKTHTRPVLIRRVTRPFMQLINFSRQHTGAAKTAITRRAIHVVGKRTETIVHQLQRVRWAAIFHAILALWGVVVVGIHTSAEIKHASTPQLPVCPIQFSKWAHNAPECLLLDIDCQALGISGTADEIETHWRDVDPSSVLRLGFASVRSLKCRNRLGSSRISSPSSCTT